MADPSDRHPDPAVSAPDARARRLPWTTMVMILLVLAGHLVLSVRLRRVLNLLVLYYATRRFELSPSPPGSVTRARARLAVWLLTTTLTVGFTWKLVRVLPLGLAILARVMAAATVLVGFRLLFVRGHKLSDHDAALVSCGLMVIWME